MISSAGTHFYGIGLSNFGSGSQMRDRFHNPIFVALISTMLFIPVVSNLFQTFFSRGPVCGPSNEKKSPLEAHFHRN